MMHALWEMGAHCLSLVAGPWSLLSGSRECMQLPSKMGVLLAVPPDWQDQRYHGLASRNKPGARKRQETDFTK